MTQVFRAIKDLRGWVLGRKSQHRRIALVPTMGALHRGHLALVTEAQHQADDVIVSIFVNPLQFGPQEDLARYPRPFESDLQLLQQVGVAAVFAPSAEEMYPSGVSRTRVTVETMSDVLCGRTRPTHFEGVTTVVAKLFNIAEPDIACFGQKDWQQLAIVRQMAIDLNFPVEIVAVPTVREDTGLALSSRNQYLSAEEKMQAALLYQALMAARRLYDAGERSAAKIRAAAEALLHEADLTPEYVELVERDTLKESPDRLTGPSVLALAVRIGRARLIDNVMLG